MSELARAVASLVATGRDLEPGRAHAAVAELIQGNSPDALVAAFLTALRIKGESAPELAEAVDAIRARAIPFDPGGTRRDSTLLDTCGTGGDGACTVNISTAAAIVVASCGVRVVKHGNRSASGNSGSAEVLETLGVAIDLDPAAALQCLDELGLCFLFAPRYHPALRALAPVRKALPFRTLFNLIGPLANPARPSHQLVGVSGDREADLLAGALARLGTKRAAVVVGSDGLDEVTLGGATSVRWVRSGRIETEIWRPGDFSLPEVHADQLCVAGPVESANRVEAVFQGEPGPDRSAILANAAAALLVVEAVENLAAGVAVASGAIDSGATARLLDRWRRFTAIDQSGTSDVGQISS